MKNQDPSESNRHYFSLAGAPFVLIVAPICGFYIGSWIDTYFATSPYFMYFFLFVGLSSGVREFYKIVKTVGNDD